jgi:hypothetical protein
MRWLIVFLACVVGGIYANPSAARASTAPPPPGETTWMDHDTAVYVVSTLNLLRTSRGHSSIGLMVRKLHVTHFEVWKDLKAEGLFFIEFKREDGSLGGALAYQMGWVKPSSVLPSVARFGIALAPASIVRAFRFDPTRLLASFNATHPRYAT